MNFDAMYTYLIDSAWFFLGSWVVMLLSACVMAFRQDWAANPARPALGKSTH